MHLFFELDGTLMDSFPRIWRGVNHALSEVGEAPVTDRRLDHVF
jgi:phosphoglycolate phosphatase-like HAD superfamily hydrolase